MKRELILLLLGIISLSTLSSLLSEYVQVDNDKVLLDTVVGVVGAGNFSYWQLGHTGAVLVELTSLTGDADLYVSDNARPGYETEHYNLSSATCGRDLVYVPPEFPRPIGIGVFGHWSHSESEYSIQVFQESLTDHILSSEDQDSCSYVENNSEDDISKPPFSRRSESDQRTPTPFLLHLLEMILEMLFL